MNGLYVGEESAEAYGYPAVGRYFQGDRSKPLIVFVPGAHHNARIAYGGHEGSRVEDFLAHWITKLRYNFLAISYPIATASGFMSGLPAPGFSAQMWGQQIAELASSAILRHKLTGPVVLLSWSMGGKAVQPAFKAATSMGLTVAGAISMMATPGIPGLSPQIELKKSAVGYADRSVDYSKWIRQLMEVNRINQGREIIPERTYLADYVGDIPVGLEGLGEVYKNGAYQFDSIQQANDYGAFEFADYPLVAVLANDGRLDYEHVVMDANWWSIYNAQTLLSLLRRSGNEPSRFDDGQWRRLRELSVNIRERLVIPIEGNHFAFVGEHGASRVALAIDQAVSGLESIYHSIASFCNVSKIGRH
ncbi:hypothetical protein PQR05_34025 [Paraburkholderia sediminicola]|uniref:hypothetical protein n=1 Tax=Paraburkholderia sediminicola TaxID=458836 RepID=UPI0038BD59F1